MIVLFLIKKNNRIEESKIMIVLIKERKILLRFLCVFGNVKG